MINVELLEKVKNHILEEPNRLRMSAWLMKNLDKYYHRPENGVVCVGESSYGEPAYIKVPTCNTVGCIAGWALMLSDIKDIPLHDVEYEAKKLLGLDSYQAARLFRVIHWPPNMADAYELAPDQETRAKLVAQMIDKVIEQSKAEVS